MNRSIVLAMALSAYAATGLAAQQAPSPAAPAPAMTHDHMTMMMDHPSITPADTAGLGKQLADVQAATARYQDQANAVADGYRLIGRETPLMGEHWYLAGQGDKPLDLLHPPTLQYANIGGKKQLVGVAYTVFRRPTDPVPEGFIGPLDDWHAHDLLEVAKELPADDPILPLLQNLSKQAAQPGSQVKTYLTMVHAWQLANPDGPFAQIHRALPYLRLGLPASFANGADEDAAWGVNLLMPRGCVNEAQRTNALAHITLAQGQQLVTACGEALAPIKAIPNPGQSPDKLNAAASAAWKSYVKAREGILTAAQNERMKSAAANEMIVPPMGPPPPRR
jgi:hypothetical protein